MIVTLMIRFNQSIVQSYQTYQNDLERAPIGLLIQL